MVVCLNKVCFGELVDFFNGLDDLKERIICILLDLDIIFSDDLFCMMCCVWFVI